MKSMVFVVSHTHWDREWYFTKSTFQMMNVDMMARLLSLLETQPDFRCFLQDGQLIALEDYLSVCQGERERITRLIREGRLAVGPWYVLPDEYLASGEAHIRNYMEGMRLARDFGGGMRLGYLPDSFGHPSQMPQIIRGLGMEEMIFWRGTGPEVAHAEFNWVGKDGSCILALNMVYGYSNAANLKDDPGVREKRLDHEIEKLMRISHLEMALLMNGSDHIAPDGRVAGWIQAYAKKHPELDIRHGALCEYVDEAKRRSREVSLQSVHGELRSGFHAYLLGDTLSTRMPIKQAQRRVEVLLENRLEPLFALLSQMGLSAYPTDKLRYLWRLLLSNLPHDSICGCGADAVHREMFMRYHQMDEIGGHLLDIAREALAPPCAENESGGEITVLHAGLHAETTQVTATLDKVLHPLRYVDYEQDQRLLEFEGEDDCERPTGVELTDAEGHIIQGYVTDSHIVDTIESDLMTQPTMHRVLRVTCAFTATLPPMSLSRFAYRFTYAEMPTGAGALENAYLRVTAAPDGTLSIFDKRTERWHHGLVRLTDTADVGDEYTFDALPGDTPVTLDKASVRVRVHGSQLMITGEMALPARCAEDRKSRSGEIVRCPLTITATMPEGLSRVDVRVEIDNRAEDHRVMALFPLIGRATRCLCDATFSIEERVIVRDLEADAYAGWKEKPNNSFFQKNFADLSNDEGGLSVFVRGLPQFEVQTDEGGDQLRVTLLRCVGWLSRSDLRSRDGNGGWSVETPEAQEKGLHAFELAIYPHPANEPPHALFNQALAFVAPPIALQTSRDDAGEVAPPFSLLSVDDDRVALSAFKAAEDGDGLILRLLNMSSDSIAPTLRLNGMFTIEQTNLAEEATALPYRAREATLHFSPWRIMTLRLK